MDCEIIYQVFNKFPEIFKDTFNKCLDLGVFPSSWKKGKLIVLKKNTGSKVITPSNLRLITLINTFAKLFEKALLKRLSWHSERNHWLNANQFGFRKGRSTETSLINIKNSIATCFTNKEFCALIAIDISKAFDSAWWDGLFASLRKSGCPKNLLALIIDYFKERFVEIEIDEEKFYNKLSRGCPQGSSLSPFFWNIFFNPIFDISLPSTAKTYGYADDLVLLVKGSSIEEMERDIKISLQKITLWCTNNFLNINASKTKVCLFSNHHLLPSISINLH